MPAVPVVRGATDRKAGQVRTEKRGTEKKDRIAGQVLVLSRYVERNAVSAKLVERAQDWPWGSAHGDPGRGDPLDGLLAAWPVWRRANWRGLLNVCPSESEQTAVRTSLAKGRPLGDDA